MKMSPLSIFIAFLWSIFGKKLLILLLILFLKLEFFFQIFPKEIALEINTFLLKKIYFVENCSLLSFRVPPGIGNWVGSGYLMPNP